jgi:hypothetical protein
MTQIFDMILFKLKFCPNVLNLKVVVLKPRTPKEILLLEKSEKKKPFKSIWYPLVWIILFKLNLTF